MKTEWQETITKDLGGEITLQQVKIDGKTYCVRLYNSNDALAIAFTEEKSLYERSFQASSEFTIGIHHGAVSMHRHLYRYDHDHDDTQCLCVRKGEKTPTTFFCSRFPYPDADYELLKIPFGAKVEKGYE